MSKIETNLPREQWLERRAVGIGSSDAAVIVGVSPYKSAFQLYHEKIGVEKPHPGEVEALRWGNILERPIAQRYAEETHRTLEFLSEPGAYTLVRNAENPWMHATLDGLVVGVVDSNPDAKPCPAAGNGVIEIKNASSYVGERWKDEPPIEFIVQLQHQLAVTGSSWGSLAALIGGVVFLWQDIARDDAFIDKLITLEIEFMARVRDKTPPDVDGSERTKEFLRYLYPKDIGTSIVLPVDFLDVASDLVTAKAEIKRWESRKMEIENTLKAAMADATMARLPDGSAFTLKHQTRGEHVVSASEFRVLRYTSPKLPRLKVGAPALMLPEVREE